MLKFRKWLDTEIKDLDRNAANHLQYSEALRIREMFKQTAESELEVIAGEMCDHYCVFPQAYDTGHEDDNERMVAERCDSCPLNRLVR